MRSLLKSIVVIIAVASITVLQTNAQDKDTVNTPSHKINNALMKRHYFTFGFDAETSIGLRGGFSFGYMRHIGKERKYYVGLLFKGFPRQDKRAITAYYNGYETNRGKLESNIPIVSFGITQRYFFHPEESNSAFLSLDMGIMSIQSQIETSFYYYSGFPFGWLPNGDDIFRNNAGALSIHAGGGYKISIFERSGIYILIGVTVTKKFEVIDPDTVFYNGAGIQYETFTSNPVFINIGIGFLM